LKLPLQKIGNYAALPNKLPYFSSIAWKNLAKIRHSRISAEFFMNCELSSVFKSHQPGKRSAAGTLPKSKSLCSSYPGQKAIVQQ